VEHRSNLGILVGGGPAPGINSVIGAATIRARLEAIDVIGLRDGFEWIMHGDIDHVIPLTIDAVSRIHFRGGSYIGISRANPTSDPQHLQNTVDSLLRLKVTQLITIGGLAPHRDHEVPPRGRLRVNHEVLDDLGAEVTRRLIPKGVDVGTWHSESASRRERR
jgi:6-phosphofructokinase 1